MKKLLVIGIVFVSLFLMGCQDERSKNEGNITWIEETNWSYLDGLRGNTSNMVIGTGEELIKVHMINDSYIITFNRFDECKPIDCLHTNNSLAYCIECPFGTENGKE